MCLFYGMFNQCFPDSLSLEFGSHRQRSESQDTSHSAAFLSDDRFTIIDCPCESAIDFRYEAEFRKMD